MINFKYERDGSKITNLKTGSYLIYNNVKIAKGVFKTLQPNSGDGSLRVL